MKNYYLRIVKVSLNKFEFQIYSPKGKFLDSVGSFEPGVGSVSSILRIRINALHFWIRSGLRLTPLSKKILLFGSVL